MSPAALAVALLVALAALGVVLNHVYARLALVELALNEGLPPGHNVPVASVDSSVSAPAQSLARGLHIFLSRNCHACQRLIHELDTQSLSVDEQVYLRYVDRPRPIAASAADRLGAELHVNEGDAAAKLGADPLPFAIAVGDHGLVAAQVSPTMNDVATVARDAGLRVRTQDL